MLQSRILCTDVMQALSHQSLTIRLSIEGQEPEWLSQNLKLNWCDGKHLLLVMKFCITFLPWIHSQANITLPTTWSIILEHLSVVCGLQEGWIFIFYFPGVTSFSMYSDKLPMKRVLKPGCLCRIISGQLAVSLLQLEALQEAKNRIIHQ